jgi:hypothetical protein
MSELHTIVEAAWRLPPSQPGPFEQLCITSACRPRDAVYIAVDLIKLRITLRLPLCTTD